MEDPYLHPSRGMYLDAHVAKSGSKLPKQHKRSRWLLYLIRGLAMVLMLMNRRNNAGSFAVGFIKRGVCF
jgi:hypothetical protein